MVKALLFDVFGTLVDWRTGIACESEKLLAPFGHKLDWLTFADAWRGEYQTGMEEVRSGQVPFSKLDIIHRRNLDRILPRFNLTGLTDSTLADLNLAWHRLNAWPDVRQGLARLKSKFLIAPLSNGNISLMVHLARRNEFPWDAILGAEVAGDYKPKSTVYLKSCEALDLPPSKCMMVAAHSYDLVAAASCGLCSGHIARPDEAGPGKGERSPKVPVDFAASSLIDLAEKLGT
jgi:2-haloacid dehalogenase